MTDKPMPLTAEEEARLRRALLDCRPHIDHVAPSNVAALLATLDSERAAREAAERERDQANKPWHFRLTMPDPVDTYVGYDCQLVDTGHSDRIFVLACSELAERLEDLARENADLRAVVERLPLSADGVRITPGMSVWTPKGMFSGTAVQEHTPVLVGDEDMLGEVEEYLWTWYAKSCYSTRAAAEAARRAPDAAERGGRVRRHWFKQEWNEAGQCPGPTPTKDRVLGVLNIWRIAWWHYADGRGWGEAWVIWQAWYWFDWTAPEPRK